jgi:hypothetical protein
MIPESHRADYAKALDLAANRAGNMYDSNLSAIDEGLANIEKRISNSLTDKDRDRPSRAAQASDIRRMLLGFGDSNKAATFLSGAIKAGDIVVVDAVLNAHPALSGITENAAKVLRSAAEEKFAAADVAQRDAAKKVAEAIDNARRNFQQFYWSRRPHNLKSNDKAAKALERLRAGTSGVGA